MQLTPLHLKLLLHAYSHCEPWPHNGGCAREYEFALMDAGLIIIAKNQEYYECTNKGKAHVEQLMNLPLPQQAWIGANGDVLLKTND